MIRVCFNDSIAFETSIQSSDMADARLPEETAPTEIAGSAPVQPEEVDHPGDDGYVDDESVLSQSVRSSVYDFKYENGRRYHAFREGAYFAPNDEPEQERMDIQARAMTLASGSLLHHCPVKDPQRILDVGTGTGIWAIEAGDTYPAAEVIGCDLSPIQPDWVPPNVKFLVDDAEDTWTWPDDHFDLIFTRLLVSGSIMDKKKYFTQAFRYVHSFVGLPLLISIVVANLEDGSKIMNCGVRRDLTTFS